MGTALLAATARRCEPGTLCDPRYTPFLSYIGVGLSEKVASLGRVIETSSKHMQSAPYLFFIPLIVTALISVSLYIVGQTLADASDPRNHMI